MHPVVVATVLLSFLQLIVGGISLLVGIIMSVQSVVWLAHSISPIWSGAFVSVPTYIR